MRNAIDGTAGIRITPGMGTGSRTSGRAELALGRAKDSLRRKSTKTNHFRG